MAHTLADYDATLARGFFTLEAVSQEWVAAFLWEKVSQELNQGGHNSSLGNQHTGNPFDDFHFSIGNFSL